VQRLAWAGVYAFKLLENVYIVHPPLFGVNLASTLLRGDQTLFGTFIPRATTCSNTTPARQPVRGLSAAIYAYPTLPSL
jgi:hypothetical protein